MVQLSCHCRNVIISANELPNPFTPTEFARQSNLLPHVDPEDEAFEFVGSNETMAPISLAIGGIKIVYPDLVIRRQVGPVTLFKCAICSLYTHATSPSQGRSIVVNMKLEVSHEHLFHACTNHVLSFREPVEGCTATSSVGQIFTGL